MDFAATFLEGIISFISPCMLPMLPLYVSYFAGGADKKQKIFFRALAFVIGFSVVFCILGVFSGSVGKLLHEYSTAVNIISGIIVIMFGLSFLEVIKIPFFKGMKGGREVRGIISAFVFGIVYSVSLTPCVGAFLGSALALAATSSSALKGGLLLAVYSAGMGIPFLLSAVLIDKLRTAFSFIKRHYRVINIVCGVFLIAVGIIMMTGKLNSFMSFLS